MKFDAEKEEEIAEARSQRFETKRPTVPLLEDRLFKPIACLDHGFVRLIDYMGDVHCTGRPVLWKGTKLYQ